MNISKISKVVCVFLILAMLIGVFSVVFLDLIMNLHYQVDVKKDYYNFMLIFLRVCGVLGVYVIYVLLRVFKTISLGNPFVRRNELDLKQIAVLSFLYGLLFICKMFFYPSLITLGVIILTLGLGICAYVFSQLFKQSVIFKEDTDLTI